MLASFNVGGPWSVGLEQNFVQTMEILQQRHPDLDAAWLCETKLRDRAFWHLVRNSARDRDGSDWPKFRVYATNPTPRSGREPPKVPTLGPTPLCHPKLATLQGRADGCTHKQAVSGWCSIRTSE